jgi:hypothetical protein
MTYVIKLDWLLVVSGHLIDPNTTDNANSSVVSLRSIRISIAAAELNDLDIMVGDVSSAYLEAFTQELCFLAGPEFGPLGLQVRDGMTTMPILCASWIFILARQTQMCG